MRPIAFVAFATLAAAFPEMFLGRLEGGFTSHLLEQANFNPSLLQSEHVGTSNITQKLDHFDSTNNKTWKQRFFYNHEYAKNNSDVNLLYIFGEGTGQVDFIIGDFSYVYYAKQLNADIYGLEHRFYGESHPTKNTSDENLKYLSSRQAIKDIAEFIRQINEKKGRMQKWIVVGGSYAGNIAAWSRLLHPELISGAIASSGPILAQLDFYGYLQTVDNDFKGQGGLCYSQLGDGIEKARQLLQSKEGRAVLTETFKITPPLSAYESLSDYDKDNFFSFLLNSFMRSAQYDYPPLKRQCKIFTAGGPEADPVKAFAPVVSSGFSVNFTADVEFLSRTEFAEDLFSMRLWLYQTCSEFGYFQSTNRGWNIFGETQSTNLFIEYCVQLFGIGADDIEKNIESTNEYYGERDNYAGTNVIFSHGTQDPWSFLAKTSDPKHESVVIAEVEGGSHCADIGPSCFSHDVHCTDNMKQIQSLTLENMRRWIDPAITVPERVYLTSNAGQHPKGIEIIATSVNSKVLTKIGTIKPITSTYSNEIDFSKWNKFTGKGRRFVPPPAANDLPSEWADMGYIEQTWDHFNPDEKRTFKQKWYSNEKFGSNDGPNFLMIGGEGPEGPEFTSYESLAWMTYAKEVGANVFDLEHRYYGESKLGTNDLQYLTSAQMLYDVASFIRAQKLEQNLTGPWITFGGSYPGALAAWSREWFPDLIIGAVGSSGPVLAKNDFYEYLEVVENVIKRHSQKCYNRTSEAFDTLERLVQSPDGRAIIQQKFNLFPVWTSDPNQTISALDLNTVFATLSDIYAGTVQYNDVDWKRVSVLCSYFEDDKITSLDALSAIRHDAHRSAISSDYMADVKYLKSMRDYVDGHNHTFSDEQLAILLWTWQTCNEFGYYQTTDYGEGIFGTPLPLNFFIIMCEQVFDVKMDDVVNGIARTNRQYGGRNKYNTTNVVLPNGDGDPWHALGIVEQGNLDKSVVPILINGTSHCADMGAATEKDPPQLTKARERILENIKQWLANDYGSSSTRQSPIDTNTQTASSESSPTLVSSAKSILDALFTFMFS